MTTIIDRTAALGCVVNGAEKLPFARTHFGACVRAAWWSIKQEAHDKAIALADQKAAKLVEPECLIGARRWCCQHLCGFSCHGGGVADCMVVMKSRKMFLKLKGGVELFGEIDISVFKLTKRDGDNHGQTI